MKERDEKQSVECERAVLSQMLVLRTLYVRAAAAERAEWSDLGRRSIVLDLLLLKETEATGNLNRGPGSTGHLAHFLYEDRFVHYLFIYFISTTERTLFTME